MNNIKIFLLFKMTKIFLREDICAICHGLNPPIDSYANHEIPSICTHWFCSVCLYERLNNVIYGNQTIQCPYCYISLNMLIMTYDD